MLKYRNRLPILPCLLFIAVFCLFTSCRTVEENVSDGASMEMESSSEPNRPAGPESAAPPEDSSPAEDSTIPQRSTAPEPSKVELIEIVPNESLPEGEIPQPDAPPDVPVTSPDGEYESGKIVLSRYESQDVVITDEAVKTAILGYVDGMNESAYNAENTPPVMGGGGITVTVHRNEQIEQYVFTEQTKDGHSLAKDLQTDAFLWKIVDSNAYPYLSALFP